jgi:hypothetical protein
VLLEMMLQSLRVRKVTLRSDGKRRDTFEPDVSRQRVQGLPWWMVRRTMMVEVEQQRSRLCWVTPIREANRICKRTDVLRLGILTNLSP